MMVVDASALVSALVEEPRLPGLWNILTEEDELHVPHLLDYEFRSALRGMILRKAIVPARAEGACLIKDSLPLIRHPESVTGQRAWDLRDNFTVYDASYVALAEAMGCALLTSDGKIAREAKTVEVTYVPVGKEGN
jgi:predicted nucleic acid-binding protein